MIGRSHRLTVVRRSSDGSSTPEGAVSIDKFRDRVRGHIGDVANMESFRGGRFGEDVHAVALLPRDVEVSAADRIDADNETVPATLRGSYEIESVRDRITHLECPLYRRALAKDLR